MLIAMLKERLVDMEKFYAHRAEIMRRRMECATQGSNIQRDIRDVYHYRRGEARAVSEIIHLLDELLAELYTEGGDY